VLENGAVAVFHDKIVAVGRTHEILSRFHGELIDHGDAILCPGLVNCHTHLELSALHMRLASTGSFTRWVTNMLEAKEAISQEEGESAVKNAIQALTAQGTIAIGDVGNQGPSHALLTKNNSIITLFFQEIICLKAKDTPDLDTIYTKLSVLEHETFLAAVAPHACYSVYPGLIKAIKDLCNRHNRPFSIHVAESREEIEFLAFGTGPMQEFLKKKGKWPLEFQLPKVSPIQYLHDIGVLDSNTICVHCVHLSDKDLNTLASSGATVCLCPRSNIFLGADSPPVAKLIAKGIPIAIGTDSLASNDKLSIFAELSFLARLAPEASSEALFRAATLSGANALGMAGHIGALEDNKRARFLSILAEDISHSKDVYEFLVHYALTENNEETLQWISHSSTSTCKDMPSNIY
jgi:cytosine/adenosine deaminase-related metal-dependent hydrolase